MPSRVQWLVWNFLVSRGPCLHAWKLLSRSLLRADVKGGKPEDKPLGLYRYREHIARPTHPLSHYTQPLESPTLDFVTHLVLSGRCGFSVREMMCLSDMRNLGILEVIRPVDGTVSSTTSFSSSEYDEYGDGADQEAAAAAMTFPPLTDRLVRAWAEKEDPFPRLRVLRVWGVGTTTRESLRWVAALPALVVYDVLGKPESWESEADVAGDGGEWERLMPSGDEASLVEQLVAADAAATGTAADVSRKWQSGMDGNTANRVDRELVSAYMHDGDGDGDGEPSRSATVRFVDYGEALRLVDAPATAAAADEAPRTVRGMIDATDSEAWAFWMYALIGQTDDDDQEDDDDAGRLVRNNSCGLVGSGG
ncbi:hypothetical protein GMORB2_1932 [Geosmithia morbida]|uniref:Uncharacterized protein n=1 Tax=Geosmithia morbida TaxID=1094350 RepID=A0A9P4YT15_9HYPO|nr:uncharacterized protein GMORB2_1932 [Geosmithia morbida]KAF4121525.1 hypothetical protein GMORB2_1932 [Geosmithia morbida]